MHVLLCTHAIVRGYNIAMLHVCAEGVVYACTMQNYMHARNAARSIYLHACAHVEIIALAMRFSQNTWMNCAVAAIHVDTVAAVHTEHPSFEARVVQQRSRAIPLAL